MAKSPEHTQTATTEAPKAKRTRTPSEPKTVYAVIQVLDADGTPVQLTKAQVRVLSFEKSAEKVLEIVESGQHPGAMFLRGKIPAGR